MSNKLYWNHGCMSEAAKAILDYAFNGLGINREENFKAVRHGEEVTYTNTKLIYSIDK